MPTSERHDRRDDHVTDAELNELVDGALAGRDLTRAQAHLTSCAECEERYQTLQATVAALQHAPSVMPRRSFQLSPEQAKLPVKVPSRLDRFTERILPGIPAIKLATIAVALLFVSVTAFDVLTGQSGQDDMSPQTSVQREADLPAADNAQPAATEAPAFSQPDDPSSDASDSDVALEESAPGDAPAADTDSSSDEESFSGAAMQEAPAPAVVQATLPASPTAEPTSTPVPIASPTATATPAPGSDGWSAGITLSWWRIAELGLFMVLAWLLVSWVGRSRVESSDDDAKEDAR